MEGTLLNYFKNPILCWYQNYIKTQQKDGIETETEWEENERERDQEIKL